MGPEALTKLLKTAPAGRHIIIGLAQVEDSRRRLSTPTTKGRIVKDWLLADLIHVVSAEPANGRSGGRKSRTKR